MSLCFFWQGLYLPASSKRNLSEPFVLLFPSLRMAILCHSIMKSFYKFYEQTMNLVIHF